MVVFVLCALLLIALIANLAFARLNKEAFVQYHKRNFVSALKILNSPQTTKFIVFVIVFMLFVAMLNIFLGVDAI